MPEQLTTPTPAGASAPSPAPSPAPSSAPADRPVRLPVAVLVVVATLVVALLAVWGTTVVSADRLPTGPAVDPPAALPPTQTTLTVDGRDVSFQEFSMTLAGSPYTCAAPNDGNVPIFLEQVLCSTVVHRDYDAAGDDWYAVTGVALVGDSSVQPDLRDTAREMFDFVVDSGYEKDVHPEVTKRQVSEAPVPAPDGAAVTYSGEVHVSTKGLPTTFDKVVVYAFALQSGKNVVFFSEFPHDGSRAALDSLVASVRTIRANG